MINTMTFLTLTLSLAFAATGCQRTKAASPSQPPPTAVQAAATKSDATAVASIVFVGKEKACDCTRKTVEAGWTALQQALGTPAKVPVRRLQIDTQADQVEPYRQLKPIMALPAIFLLDSRGGLVEFLQGEVTAPQIVAALK